MTEATQGVWRTIAVAPGGPITALAARDRATFLCGSLAGVALSRDGGGSWRWLAPGRVGPLVTDVAMGPSDQDVTVAGAGVLYRSADGGSEWRSIDLTVAALVRLDDERVLVVDHEGSIALVEDSSGQVRVGRIEGPSAAAAVTVDRDGMVWVVAEGRVTQGQLDGRRWMEATGLPGHAADVVTADGRVYVLLDDGRLAQRSAGGTWSLAQPGPLGEMIAAAVDAPVVAVCGQRSIAWTIDAGRTWSKGRLEAEPTAVTVANDGSVILVGMEDSRVLVVDASGDRRAAHTGRRGTVGRVLTPPPTGVVSDLAWDAGGITVAGFGTTWRWAGVPPAWETRIRAPGLTEVAPLARDSVTGATTVAGEDGILKRDRIVLPPRGTIPRSVASATRGAAGDVVVTDGRAIHRRMDESTGWVDLSEPGGGEVITVGLGRPGAGSEDSVVVGIVDDEGLGAVWALDQDRWVRLAKGETGGARIRIVSVDGARGVYAAIGSTVYRPAMAGAALLAPEALVHAPGLPIMGLAAARGGVEDLVIALTADAVHVSANGGLDWTLIQLPAGPPATALALRADPVPEVLVARLGGELLAVAI